MLTPLRHRNYRFWAGADVLCVAGIWMQVLAINWLVLAATGSAAAMGVSVMLQALPVLLLGGWGGALADRLPARPVLVTCQLLRVALSAALVLSVLADRTTLWPVYLVTVLSGTVSAVEGPVLGRFGSTLVPRDLLGRVLALGATLGSGARILGMSLGGLLVGIVGPAGVFAVTTAGFVAVVPLLLRIRLADAYPIAVPADPRSAGVRAGLRYLVRQPVILVVLGLSFVLGCVVRNQQITMTAMSRGPLAAGPDGYGRLSLVFAAGALLGGLLLAVAGRTGLGILLGAGALVGLLQAVSALAPGPVAFAALIAPVAAAAVVVDTVVATRVQLDTREDMRGRMLAALGLVAALAGIVGAPALGWLCDTLGARGGVLVAGAVAAAAVFAAAVTLVALPGRAAPAAAAVAERDRRAVRWWGRRDRRRPGGLGPARALPARVRPAAVRSRRGSGGRRRSSPGTDLNVAVRTVAPVPVLTLR